MAKCTVLTRLPRVVGGGALEGRRRARKTSCGVNRAQEKTVSGASHHIRQATLTPSQVYLHEPITNYPRQWLCPVSVGPELGLQPRNASFVVGMVALEPDQNIGPVRSPHDRSFLVTSKIIVRKFNQKVN